MKTLVCIYFLLSIFLSACVNVQDDELPTQTIEIASSTPDVKASLPVANTPFQDAICAHVDDNAQSNFGFVGQIVIKDDSVLSLCNLATGLRQSLPGTENSLYFTTSFSPDYKHFSYIDSTNNLVIVSAAGDKQIIDLQEEVGYWVMDWLSDNEIVFALPARDDGSMIVYNIDSDEFQEVITNIDDINNLDPISWYGGNTPISIIDPSLSRLVYLS